MDASNNIATDLFYKVRSRFTGLKLGNETGTITINPEEARFFDFDYMEGDTPIGHVTISLAEHNSMKVYFSSGITESMDTMQKNNWYGFLKELRNFAKRRLMSFDTRDIAKDNLEKQDFQFLSQHNQPASTSNTITRPVGESIMSESSLYGTKTMSFQKLMDTRLIIKHSHALTDDQAPGARSRNISGLFVENADGERFKYPFIHLAGARAMQRHVANGGVPYDAIGNSIVKMSEEIAQLKSFGNYVVRNDLMNTDTNGIVGRSSEALNGLREQLARLSKQSHYEAYRESFQEQAPVEVPQEVVEDYTEKFTVRNFKEDIKTVFPVLYRLMKESEVGYADIVAMTTQQEIAAEDTQVIDADGFDQFESWVMNLGQEGQSVKEAPKPPHTGDYLLEEEPAMIEFERRPDQEYPTVTSVKVGGVEVAGILSPDELNEISQYIDEGETSPTEGWVTLSVDIGTEYSPAERGSREFGTGLQMEPDYDESNDITDVIAYGQDGKKVALDFEDLSAGAQEYLQSQADEQMQGDDDDYDRYEAINPKNPRDYERPAVDRKNDGQPPLRMQDVKAKDTEHKRNYDARVNGGDRPQKESINVQEVAEFIHSFYDKESGTFPKGPEGVATMVGKKFGEQAENVARKMVERMAPQQQEPELAELARIKHLSGM